MKVCSKCKVEKELTEFSKNSRSKDGLRCNCKECNAVYKKLYHQKNRDKLVEYSKEYNKNNKDKSKEYSKNYRKNNKNKISNYQKEYREKYKEEFKEKRFNYVIKNKEKISDYRLKNKKKYIGYSVKWKNKKIKEDYLFRFKLKTRSLIYKSFKRGQNNFIKYSRTEEILGCTMQEFVDFILLKLTEGMTLENYGEWHLDHIIPMSSAKTEEEVIKLNHYTNFQPLWAIDNFKKGNKY